MKNNKYNFTSWKDQEASKEKEKKIKRTFFTVGMALVFVALFVSGTLCEMNLITPVQFQVGAVVVLIAGFIVSAIIYGRRENGRVK